MADEQTGAPQSPEVLSQEQLDQRVADIANRAYSARKKQLEREFDQRLEERMSKFREEFSAQSLQSRGNGGSGKRGKGADDDAATTENIELNSLKSQLAAIQRQADEAARQRDAYEQRIRNDQLRAEAVETLKTLGADPDLAPFAYDHLFVNQRLAMEGDSGQYRPVYKESDDDVYDLQTGLKKFLASQNGKKFLQNREVRGSGSRPPAPGAKLTREMADSLIAQSIGDIFRSNR